MSWMYWVGLLCLLIGYWAREYQRRALKEDLERAEEEILDLKVEVHNYQEEVKLLTKDRIDLEEKLETSKSEVTELESDAEGVSVWVNDVARLIETFPKAFAEPLRTRLKEWVNEQRKS